MGIQLPDRMKAKGARRICHLCVVSHHQWYPPRVCSTRIFANGGGGNRDTYHQGYVVTYELRLWLLSIAFKLLWSRILAESQYKPHQKQDIETMTMEQVGTKESNRVYSGFQRYTILTTTGITRFANTYI